MYDEHGTLPAWVKPMTTYMVRMLVCEKSDNGGRVSFNDRRAAEEFQMDVENRAEVLKGELVRRIVNGG